MRKKKKKKKKKMELAYVEIGEGESTTKKWLFSDGFYTVGLKNRH
jgi:hypothetical protein